jgi:peptidase M1-like protein
VTKVTQLRVLTAVFAVLAFVQPAYANDTPAAAVRPKNAEELYSQLQTVGLDKSRVFRIRDASLDRSSLHIAFENGTVAFTQDVDGRVTGAYFEGEGEVLLIPPNKMERASMALFTGMAILEEQFITGYFRFNDDTYAELEPFLRPADNAQEFLTEWDDTARRLADLDALRLFLTFSRNLPTAEPAAGAGPQPGDATPDRMLHARLQGRKLRNFDLFYDSLNTEQIWAGQSRTVEGVSYYDLWTSFTQSRGGADDKPSEIRKDEIYISHYTIRADVKPPTDLSADARLQVEVRRGGMRTLLFELSRFLHVKTVEANGRKVEFINNQALEGTQLARRGNDLVAVVFPAPLKSGEKLELHFTYGGEVLSEAAKGLLYVGARGTWYPNRGLAMADFDLEFHYPADWTLVATGQRTQTTAEAGAPGEQTSRWISDRPMPVAGFNLGKYVHAGARAGDVVVESFATAGMEGFAGISPGPAVLMPDIRSPELGPPMIRPAPPRPSPAHNAQGVADRCASAVDFYSRRFGPYPYKSLALTQLPGQLSQGWPGLIFLSSYAFLTPEERTQLHSSHIENVISGQVLAHETAHQWWGDLISWASYRDQWMFEGLADYSALMVLESERPAQFREILQKYREDLRQKNKDDQLLRDAGPVTLGVRLSSSHFPDGYEAISYGRGTWLFHMLREMMADAEAKSGGKTARARRAEDEPFLRSLRKVREKYEYKVMSARDLLRVFEEDLPPSLRYEGKKSLDWFFDSWVNGTALPRFESKSVTYTQKDDATIVSGVLLQKDAPEDLVTSVPIYAVVTAKTPVLLGRVFADGPETTFRLTAPAGTRKIVVDPYQTVLSDVK